MMVIGRESGNQRRDFVCLFLERGTLGKVLRPEHGAE